MFVRMLVQHKLMAIDTIKRYTMNQRITKLIILIKLLKQMKPAKLTKPTRITKLHS